jgi:hypothetical protein
VKLHTLMCWELNLIQIRQKVGIFKTLIIIEILRELFANLDEAFQTVNETLKYVSKVQVDNTMFSESVEKIDLTYEANLNRITVSEMYCK